ncbi:hypothetical protein BKM63_21435 [Flavobacterium johnsoniae]|uniref:Uncharacterized protein n=2 Tax=Flavobacterium johnsoniae TaxID=986 RepID=A0A1J7CEK9_FLAJO|nr:hypothetical protein BKM63_21435 [Flavobacterium johnsoniae]
MNFVSAAQNKIDNLNYGSRTDAEQFYKVISIGDKIDFGSIDASVRWAITNSKKGINDLLCLFFIFGHKSNEQWGAPPVGYPNINLKNFGADSNNDAAAIEYDNFISSFHTTILRTADGSFQTWAEGAGYNDVANILTLITINTTNFPALGT